MMKNNDSMFMIIILRNIYRLGKEEEGKKL